MYQTINDLKALAATLQIKVTGDRRCKYVWAQAIAAYETAQAALELTIDTAQSAYAIVAPIAVAAIYWLTYAVAFVFFAGKAFRAALQPAIDTPQALRFFGKGISYHPANPYASRWFASTEPGHATVHINSAAFALFW